MTGNDGNTWEIIIDSRGVHRWQKSSNSYIGTPSKAKEIPAVPEGERGIPFGTPRTIKIAEEAPKPKPKVVISDDLALVEFVKRIDSIEGLKELAEKSEVDSPEKFVAIIRKVAAENEYDKPIDLLYEWEEKEKKNYGAWFNIGREFYIEENKDRSSLMQSVKKSIEGARVLLEDDDTDDELRNKLEAKVRKRLAEIEVDADKGDENSKKAVKLMREFLRESFKQGGIIDKAKKRAEIFQRAASKMITKAEKEFLIK